MKISSQNPYYSIPVLLKSSVSGSSSYVQFLTFCSGGKLKGTTQGYPEWITLDRAQINTIVEFPVKASKVISDLNTDTTTNVAECAGQGG